MNIIEKVFKDIIDLNSESINNKDSDEIIEMLHKSFKHEYLKIEEDYLPIKKKQNIETVEEYACYWQKGINKLESFIFICTSFGEVFSKSYFEKKKDEKSLLAETIIQLHTRASEISMTILLLLKFGHIDAAFSQWRILHEVNVVSMFINKHGEECAERYIAYMYIDKNKSANQYNHYEKRLNEKGPTDSQLKELKRIYDKLIEKYGKSFAKDNGWACKFIHDDEKCKDKIYISFTDIEKDVHLDHLRPYYKMASQYSHVSSVALETDTSFHPVHEDYGIFSKSNISMTTVAHSLALSLMKTSSVLMSIDPSLDSLVIMKTIKDFEKEIGEIFLKIDKKVKL